MTLTRKCSQYYIVEKIHIFYFYCGVKVLFFYLFLFSSEKIKKKIQTLQKQQKPSQIITDILEIVVLVELKCVLFALKQLETRVSGQFGGSKNNKKTPPG